MVVSAVIIQGDAFQVIEPADYRPLVGVGFKGGGHGGFLHEAHRVVFGAQAPFFDHHLLFGFKGLFVDIDAPHAVCFHLQPMPQLVLGSGFEVGRYSSGR